MLTMIGSEHPLLCVKIYVDTLEFINFVPIQRIACRCAYVTMPVKFNDIIETVFIACPISFKYCV